MPRGRPKKQRFDSIDDQLEDVIFKLFDPYINESGKLEFKRTDYRLTLEDMALIKWIQEGKQSKAPLSKVGEMKQEAKVMQTIKHKLNKAGFTDADLRDLMYDMSNPRQVVLHNKFNNSIDSND